jgi:hypothetical protein
MVRIASRCWLSAPAIRSKIAASNRLANSAYRSCASFSSSAL